jgi:hypothetical protein
VSRSDFDDPLPRPKANAKAWQPPAAGDVVHGWSTPRWMP